MFGFGSCCFSVVSLVAKSTSNPIPEALDPGVASSRVHPGVSTGTPGRQGFAKPGAVVALVLIVVARVVQVDWRHVVGVRIQTRIFALFLAFLPSQAWAGGEPPHFILQWGSNGAGDGQFSGPHGIEVDTEGNVYVADTGNNRIQKFTSDGVFLIKWGSFGTAPGQFNHPHGIGIGPMATSMFPRPATIASRSSRAKGSS